MKLERIACVEDDLDIRTILEMSLSEVGGFTVELYEDGPSALEALSDVPPPTHNARYDDARHEWA